MAYTAITAAEIEAGKPTKQELFQKIKDNDTDFDSRLTTVEAITLTADPIVFEVNGPYNLKGTPQTEVLLERINKAITLLSVRLFVIDAGTAGTLEIDLEKSSAGGGSWTTIFSTRPSLAYTAGDYSLSSNAVLSTTGFIAGDLLRMNITSVQTSGGNFKVIVDYEGA